MRWEMEIDLETFDKDNDTVCFKYETGELFPGPYWKAFALPESAAEAAAQNYLRDLNTQTEIAEAKFAEAFEEAALKLA